MNRLRLTAIILRPSAFSFALSAVVTLLVLLGSNWSYLTKTPLFYDYFYGPRGLVTVMQNSPDTLSAFTDTIVAGPFTYNVVVLLIAAFVGLMVYVFLEGFDRLAASISRTWLSNYEAGENFSKTILLEARVRHAVRALGFVLWLVYLIIFTKSILPFCILMFRNGVDEPFTAQGAEYSLAGIGVLLLSFHLHAILLRLLTLRVRVFGARPELYV